MSDKTAVAGELPVVAWITGEGDDQILTTDHTDVLNWPSPIYSLCKLTDATAALAQKDGEIERLREVLRALETLFTPLASDATAAMWIEKARAALGSQA